MTGGEIPTLISVDPHKPAVGQKGLMNRWHPDIPDVVTVKPGDIFKIESHEWTGGQVKNNDDADDIKNIDLSGVHYLSGPIGVEGAEPGDILVVDILDIAPFPTMPWGFTAIFEKENGGGLFAKEFNSRAAKAIFDFQGIYATSRHIPGVRFAGIPHPGQLGTKPSPELLAKWNEREIGLIKANEGAVPPVAYPPQAHGAYVGQDLPDELRAKIYAEGARTIPGRENGANVDIKNLSRGSRCFFPVFVKNAGLTIGDLHFSQGDGEMTFCGAVEQAGISTLSVGLIKGGMAMFNQTMPFFVPSPIDPSYAQQIVFEGIGVDLHGTGEQRDMDATLAYKTAARNAIAYLQQLGYTREQAYLLLSAAPVEARIGAIVDSPNACVTLGIPVGIFDHDITPGPSGLKKEDRGQCAIRTDGIL
ncbi:hypothetical protein OC846_000190 [Tilletia horrida]|uniref:Formamidase n=1 Tax=Tilletia horrida TaxID=155126 RepID=A0AAN6GXG6_9BASI|nr:hypothetical protein OC846_000190 [Tilletia horrida]